MTAKFKRTAIYARHSTSHQSPQTNADQIANARRLIAQHADWSQDPTIFQDEGISGMTARRPGYQRLLAEVRAGSLDVIVTDSSSRSNRKLWRQLQMLEELSFLGVRVVSCDGALDTADKNFAVMVIGTGLVNQVVVDQSSRATHSAHSNAFAKGLWVTSIPYGYNGVSQPDHRRKNTRLVINPEEAKWVIKIFEWYAYQGKSPYLIADALNKLGVKNKRGGRWLYASLYPNVKRGMGILQNRLFIGEARWNRTKMALNPTVDRRRGVIRPVEERLVYKDESLRIMPDELFYAAQDRWEAIQAETAERRKTHQYRAGSGRHGEYLLSNKMLRCGCCQSRWSMVRAGLYGCISLKDHRIKCDYQKEVKRIDLEQGVLRAVEERLFDDKEVGELLVKLKAMLSPSDDKSLLSTLKRQEKAKAREIENVLAVIRSGLVTPSIVEDLKRLEAEKIQIVGEIENLTVQARTVVELSDKLDKRHVVIAQLRQLVETDPAAARELLRSILGGPITLHQSRSGVVIASMRGSIAGLLNVLGDRPVPMNNSYR